MAAIKNVKKLTLMLVLLCYYTNNLGNLIDGIRDIHGRSYRH